VIEAAAEIDVAPASAGDPLGRRPPAEAGATFNPLQKNRSSEQRRPHRSVYLSAPIRKI